jgi:hypothetical protein
MSLERKSRFAVGSPFFLDWSCCLSADGVQGKGRRLSPFPWLSYHWPAAAGRWRCETDHFDPALGEQRIFSALHFPGCFGVRHLLRECFQPFRSDGRLEVALPVGRRFQLLQRCAIVVGRVSALAPATRQRCHGCESAGPVVVR